VKPRPRKRRPPEPAGEEIPPDHDPVPDCWIALTALASREAGEQLAATLVEERLAACVNVIGGVASLYRWEGKVERDEEVLLLMKTTAAGVGPLKARVLALHPYDTPEFLAFEIGAGSPGYLDWVADSVGSARSAGVESGRSGGPEAG